MSGRLFASAGKSENESRPTVWGPAPTAYSNSVLDGASEMMRWAAASALG
jgi:hypothetical protein